MKILTSLMMLFSLASYGQIKTDANLKFLKDKKEYRKVQWEVHKELSKQILYEIPMMSIRYKQAQEFLRYNKPNIITQEVEFIEEKVADKNVIRPGQIYFVWGYNRAFHSNADMTFHTQEGTFTVHDAQGVDRPTPLSWDYINPTKLSIPQYVVKLGYMFDEKWGIELGMDHMKWVFVNDATYEVTGDFNATVFVDEEGHQWPVAQNFDEIKESGNMTWLGAEHSDGYNYVNIGAVYNLKVYETKNEVFRVDLRPNAGFGLMVPKTKINMHRDQMWSWKGLDNKFHVAGFGAHAEAKLRMTFFKRFFIEGAARGTYIKINDALVNDDGDRMSHTPIGSLQYYGAAGFNIPIKTTKKKKKIKPIY